MEETNEYQSFEQLEKAYRGRMEEIYPWLKKYDSGHKSLDICLLFLQEEHHKERGKELKKEIEEKIIEIAKRQTKGIPTSSLGYIAYLAEQKGNTQDEIFFYEEYLRREDLDHWICGVESTNEEMDKKLTRKYIEIEIQKLRLRRSYNLLSLDRNLERIISRFLKHYRTFDQTRLKEIDKDVNEDLYNEIVSALERTVVKHLGLN
jgi:hypothetical protein